MNLKNYLLGRAENLSSWIGAIGLILEIFLHMGNISTLMIVLFVLLIVMPESSLRNIFSGWTKSIKDMDKPK